MKKREIVSERKGDREGEKERQRKIERGNEVFT